MNSQHFEKTCSGFVFLVYRSILYINVYAATRLLCSVAVAHGFDEDAEIYVAGGLRDVAHGLPQAYLPTTAINLDDGSSFLQEQVITSSMHGSQTGHGLYRRHLHLRRAASTSTAHRFTPGSFSQYGIAGPEGGPNEVRTLPAAPDPTTAPARSVSTDQQIE